MKRALRPVAVLAANKDGKIESLSKLGFQTVDGEILYPPFDNLKGRRARCGETQKMCSTRVGNHKYYKICGEVFAWARRSKPMSARRRCQGNEGRVEEGARDIRL